MSTSFPNNPSSFRAWTRDDAENVGPRGFGVFHIRRHQQQCRPLQPIKQQTKVEDDSRLMMLADVALAVEALSNLRHSE